MFESIKELYRYRNMIYTFTHSELRSRYKGSMLGVVWSLLNPIFLLCIYGVVFSFLIRGRIENYFLFLFTGLLPWVFFRSSVLGSANSIIGNAGLIKKIYFPREILPLATVLNNLVNFFIGIGILFIALYIFGNGLSINVLWLPLIVMIQFVLTLGLALIFSAVTVYLRDIRQILDLVMMGMFYYTPIIYTIDMIPEKFRWLFNLNPLKSLIEAYQEILFLAKTPSLDDLLIVFVISLGIFALGIKVFSYLNMWFAEKV